MKVVVAALSGLAVIAAVRSTKADCSLNGDPLGILTQWEAFTTVNTHPPPGIFLLSDLSPKAPALPTSGIYFPGTPFNDPLYAPYGTVVAGLNGGYDVLMAADPAAGRPGAGKVVILQGSQENNGSRKGDLFILGDYRKPYYEGKTSVQSADNDFAYIDQFDPSSAVIRLHGSPNDYRLAWITGLGLPQTLQGTVILTQRTCDVVGFIRNVVPSSVGGAISPLNGKNFEYAQPPSNIPALPSATAPSVIPIDQLGGTGSVNWPGPYTSIDASGNIYVAWATSAPEIAGVGGTGSWYLAKYNPAGTRVWLRKEGLSPAQGAAVPSASEIIGSSLYVAGITFGAWGGPHPPKILTGANGLLGFIAKFDANTGALQALTQVRPLGPKTDIGVIFNMAVDNAGDLYVGGSTNAGLTLPFTSPWIMKFKGRDLSIDTAWNGGHAVVLLNGPPIVFNSLNLLEDAGTLQLANFAEELHFAPDGSGIPGRGSIYAAGSSDDGQFYGSNPGWNDVWYARLDATSGKLDPSPSWKGLGRSLSVYNADSFNRGADVDSQGYFYISGITGGDFAQYDPSVHEINPSPTGGNFVAKIDPNGNVVWLRYLSSAADANLLDMHVSNGHVYVYGDTFASLYAPNQGGTDIWVADLDTNGNLLGGLQFGSPSNEWSYDFDVNGNTMAIAGMTEGSVSKPHESVLDMFVAKVNLTGAPLGRR